MSTGKSNKENAPPANLERQPKPDKESQAPEVAPAPKVSKGKKKTGARHLSVTLHVRYAQADVYFWRIRRANGSRPTARRKRMGQRWWKG